MGASLMDDTMLPVDMREVGADLLVPARGPACGTTRNRARSGRRRSFLAAIFEASIARESKKFPRSRETSRTVKGGGTPASIPSTSRVAPFFLLFPFFLSLVDLISRPDNTTIQFPRLLPDSSIPFRLARY